MAWNPPVGRHGRGTRIRRARPTQSRTRSPFELRRTQYGTTRRRARRSTRLSLTSRALTASAGPRGKPATITAFFAAILSAPRTRWQRRMRERPGALVNASFVLLALALVMRDERQT